MNDHKAEAEAILSTIGGVRWGDRPEIEVALAQAHAILALAEQQRIANLIALAETPGGWSSVQASVDYDVVQRRIREGLGL